MGDFATNTRINFPEKKMAQKPFKKLKALEGSEYGMLVGVRTARSGITGFCFLLDSYIFLWKCYSHFNKMPQNLNLFCWSELLTENLQPYLRKFTPQFTLHPSPLT